MSGILEIQSLVKNFGSLRAVDGVSLSIAAGSCFGLLGPNGAGKTTTIELMEGIKRADGGHIRYRGEALGERFRSEAGIMFQSTALQEFINVREMLRMFGRFYPRAVPLDELVESCHLGEFLDRDTRKLSGGQRQRLLLAIALINDPQVLFLDEPTTGLDPQARRNLWALVESVKARGKTVVLTTHYMDEAYELCDRIAIMDHGRVIAEGSPDELLAAHFNDVVLHLPADDVPDAATLPMAHTRRDAQLHFSTCDVNATIAELLAAGASLGHLRVRSRNLEDLFLELTGRELRA